MDYEFEFDLGKSEANKAKHGIDFVEAQQLWKDVDRAVGPATGRVEERWALVAAIDGKCWTAIFTWRGEVIRLISVRRAREYEVTQYEKRNHH